MDMGEGLPSKLNETTDEALGIQVAHYERWHGKADGRIRVWFGLRTIFNNSDALIVRTKALADAYGVGVHARRRDQGRGRASAAATRGATTVTHLRDLGVLDRNFLAVHSVWLTDDEVQMFADHDVKVSHNPAAAMRVLGFARVPEMLEAGVCVAPLDRRRAVEQPHDAFVDEMWLASLIHKGRTLNPTVVPAQAVPAMVVLSMRRGRCSGRMRSAPWEAGKKADLTVIDPDSPAMLPMHDPVANMVTSMHAHNVESVMAGGRWLMRDREILVVNEQEVIEEAKARAAAIARRAGIVLPPRFNVVD